MHTSREGDRVRFGRFEFDPATDELFSNGSPVRLQEKPRQVLAALLARPGEVVTRDDLRERLWKSDTFVDFEHGLNTAVKKARQAIGDSAEAPAFIETVARRGYRFVGQVEPAGLRVDGTGDAGSESVEPPGAWPPARRQHRPALWIAVLLMVAGAGWGLAWLASRPSPDQRASRSSATGAGLAVMPLRVLGPDSGDFAYLGVGLADAIATRLANTRQISLRPTSAVLSFTAESVDLAKVAGALGVAHLLLGTIQPAGEVVRVSVQLVDARGVVEWGRSFDQPRGGLLELQDQVAEQVASALRIELPPDARARLRAPHTSSPAAYDRYLRGRALLLNYTEANMREAIRHFEAALEADPEYAVARTGIATACAWFSIRYAHESEALVWGKRAEEEARLALARDGSLAEAHLAIANAAGTEYGGFDWAVVLGRTDAALALDPSLDFAHLARMRAYYHLGLVEEARQEGRLAQALNPTASVEFERLDIVLLLLDGRFSAAVERATALLPRTDAPAIRQYLGLARYYAGDPNGARDMLASVSRRGRPDTRAQATLASIEAATGLGPAARARIAGILRGTEMDHHVAYSLGAAFAQLGDAASAVTWLANAADTGFPCYPWFERDTLLNPVRKHPEFVALMQRVRTTHDLTRRGARSTSPAASERP
jgi:DNA-binding winged helix-turn-helix (wHTH) protein/TolB-like protein